MAAPNHTATPEREYLRYGYARHGRRVLHRFAGTLSGRTECGITREATYSPANFEAHLRAAAHCKKCFGG